MTEEIISRHQHIIIDLHEQRFRNCEICEIFKLTPGQVAGIIWRYKNPGMYKKGVKAIEHTHRPPYRLRK